MSEIRLSLCMIVRNEAHFLRRCLQSVEGLVDEMVIVDTGSTDDTVAIAREFTERVSTFTWCDDFSAARNYSLELAQGDWILVLDADEWIEPRHLQQLRDLITTTPLDGFFLQQRNYSNNALEPGWKPVSENNAYTNGYSGFRDNPICRLFRNRPGIRFSGRVHELVDRCFPTGTFDHLDIPLHHHEDSDPTKPKASRQLAYLALMEKALAEDSDAAENPDTGRMAANAGALAFRHKQDYRLAIHYFERAIELGYQPHENREGIAEALYRLGDHAGALEAYRSLYESGYQSFSLLNNLANLLVRGGAKKAAVQLLEQALPMAAHAPEVAQRIEHNIQLLSN